MGEVDETLLETKPKTQNNPTKKGVKTLKFGMAADSDS